MYGSWDMKCNRQKFLIILGHFLPFYPLKTPKMNYQKNEKTHGDIIILHKFNKNHDHRLYCSWDMARGGCNYFHFELYFFYPLTAQKMNISKNEKKHFKKLLEIWLVYTSVSKIMIICYTAPEIWSMSDVIVTFYFELYFALLPF